MTALFRSAGHIPQRQHDLDLAGFHITPKTSHEQQMIPTAAQPSLHREVELWGLTDLPDEISVRHYGPTTRDTIESLMVPIAGGPNSYAAVRVSVIMAREWDATIDLLTVIASGADDERRMKAESRLYNYTDEITSVPTNVEVVVSDDVVTTIGQRSQDHELIVIGDSERSVFQRVFTGTVPRRLTDKTDLPIFVVEHTA